MGIPLQSGGETYGVISFRSPKGTEYSDADLQLAEELGRRFDAWLERARLIEQLRRASEAKDEFMGMISHEMRTPLTIINGGARILSRTHVELTEEERAGLVADMERESVRLLSMVDNLLAMARVELTEELETEPVIVERVVRRAVDALEKRGFRALVRVDVAESVPLVEAHEASLDQVIRNLLTNAEKYSPEGTPVTVAIREAEGMIEVAVRDAGPGVPEDEVGRLFERFYRSSKTSLQVAGSGLGLPLCKRLVEGMHGTIRAGNRPEGGFEVVFTLPILAEEPLE